jgi:hypothetical protein
MTQQTVAGKQRIGKDLKYTTFPDALLGFFVSLFS